MYAYAVLADGPECSVSKADRVPNPPAPFEDVVGKLPRDPDYSCKSGDEFSGCDESWAVIVHESANIFVAGAGLYSWFSTYTHDCIDEHACQKVLMLWQDNHAGVRFQHVISIGAEYIAVMDNKGIPAIDYLNVESHPRWSQVSVLDVAGDGKLAEMVWIDPKIWDMEQPSFTCVPPIVEYPLITVTEGDWTTTITRSPVYVTQMHFEVVTLTAGSGSNKKRSAIGFSPFWPVPATTPAWPAVTYTNQDGVVMETTLSIPFPLPPTAIGPGAPAPTAGGNWPKREIRPQAGLADDPTVEKCFWQGWAGQLVCGSMWDDIGEAIDWMPNAPNDEDYGESDVICPDPTSTTTTQTAATTEKEPEKPTKSQLEEGRPMDNIRKSYNKGQKATNAQLQGAARSFCERLGTEGTVLSNPINAGSHNLAPSQNDELPGNGQWPIHVVTELLIKPGCEFVVDYAQCERYMRGPVDSCNCEGTNGKQGGHLENRCYR